MVASFGGTQDPADLSTSRWLEAGAGWLPSRCVLVEERRGASDDKVSVDNPRCSKVYGGVVVVQMPRTSARTAHQKCLLPWIHPWFWNNE